MVIDFERFTRYNGKDIGEAYISWVRNNPRDITPAERNFWKEFFFETLFKHLLPPKECELCKMKMDSRSLKRVRVNFIIKYLCPRCSEIAASVLG